MPTRRAVAPDPGHAGSEANPAFDPALQREGVVCATCHVRDISASAPRPAGARVFASPRGQLPHNGATIRERTSAPSSRPPAISFGPRARLNGKPLEHLRGVADEARPRAVGWPARAVTMPDRAPPVARDPRSGDGEVGRAGLSLALEPRPVRAGTAPTGDGDGGERDVGHYFPTYVTPGGGSGRPPRPTASRSRRRNREGIIGPPGSARSVAARSQTRESARGTLRAALRPRARGPPGLTLRARSPVVSGPLLHGFFATLLETGRAPAEARYGTPWRRRVAHPSRSLRATCH